MPLRDLLPLRLRRTEPRRTARGPSWVSSGRSRLKLEPLEDRRLLAPVTFAQFVQVQPSNQNFVYTNESGTGATFNSIDSGNPVMVTFFESLAHGLTGPQAAHLYLSSSTSSPAGLGADGLLHEHFPTATNTLSIVLDNPPGGRSNFLTVTYSDDLSGQINSRAGNLKASDSSFPPNMVSYTSDWFDFTGSTEHSFALSFTSIISDDGRGLNLGDGNFYHSFTTSGTGTFDTSFPVGEIRGTKFEDLNGDGIREAGEPGLQGWHITLDEVGGP